MGDHEGILKKEYDDISMKTELVSTPFGSNFEHSDLMKKLFQILYWVLLRFENKKLPMQFMPTAQVFVPVIKI